MRFQAAIFDLDGTLVDSESLAIEAGRRAARALGHDTTDAFLHSLIGMDQAGARALLVAEFGEHALVDLDRAWGAEYQTLRQGGLQMKPHVTDVLDALDALALPRAVATSSRRASATSSLAAVGIADRFHTVVTRDCVEQAKPHPEPYLTAAARLSVDPAACIAFEDSATGARSAMAAGMTVVVVPDIVTVAPEIGHHRAETLMAGARLAGLL
ncbi:MAG: HAD family phosphatase [Marinibacterium sp.]|nr:HAD family phosphatase [Marinibacterium sp.]